MVTATNSTLPAARRWEADALRIGAALKRRRGALGISQADLAKRSGVVRADYEALESGDWPIRTTVESVMSLIAAVLPTLEPADGVPGSPTLAA